MDESIPANDAENLGGNPSNPLPSGRGGSQDLFFLQGSGGGTLFNLVQLVEKYCPGEGHVLTAALMTGGELSVTASQGYDLVELARIAAGDVQALAWLRSSDGVGTD